MERKWLISVHEGGLYMSNIYFKQKSLHKCTKVARGQDGVEVISLIDLVLVMEDMLHYVQQVKTERNGMEMFSGDR